MHHDKPFIIQDLASGLFKSEGSHITRIMAEEGCRLFVYGVGENTSKEDIADAFKEFGSVTDTYNTGKGYAFVTFSDPNEAKNAMADMNGQQLLGQAIKVDIAKGRPGGGGGGGGGRGRGGGGGYGRGGGGYGGGGRSYGGGAKSYFSFFHDTFLILIL